MSDSETGKEIWSQIDLDEAEHLVCGAERGYADGTRAASVPANALIRALNAYLDAIDAEVVLRPGTDYDQLNDNLNAAIESATDFFGTNDAEDVIAAIVPEMIVPNSEFGPPPAPPFATD